MSSSRRPCTYCRTAPSRPASRSSAASCCSRRSALRAARSARSWPSRPISSSLCARPFALPVPRADALGRAHHRFRSALRRGGLWVHAAAARQSPAARARLRGRCGGLRRVHHRLRRGQGRGAGCSAPHQKNKEKTPSETAETVRGRCFLLFTCFSARCPA